MSGGVFEEVVRNFGVPLTPTAVSLGPLISFCIVGFLAYVIIKGQRRYELLRMETEALIRRYVIFRGKRHTSLGKVQAQKGTNKKILKSISRSWYRFEEYHGEQCSLLEKNYRGMKRGFILGCVLLVLNTVREGMIGMVATETLAGFLFGVLQTLPSYLLAVVGMVLLSIQHGEVYGTHLDPPLEDVFTDFDREDPRLSEEFDPLEGEGEKD
jgi:hypothetical protein